MTDPALPRARELLAGAHTVVVLTGAGISAESGVPTFRGDEGLWGRYRAEDLATPEAFRRDPRLVWEWYALRRDRMAEVAPNPGHLALARLALARPGRVTLVTQNVDGLHEAAARQVADEGDPGPAMPLELHGTLFRIRCVRCGRGLRHRGAIDSTSTDTLPRCRACGDLLRPDVVWFGEALDADLLDRAFRAAQRADVCLVVGTSAVVHPAASIPLATLRSGGVLLEVNPEETPLSAHAAVVLRAPSGRMLPALLD